MFLSNDSPLLLLPTEDANEEFDEDESVIITFLPCQRYNIFIVMFFVVPSHHERHDSC